MIDITKDIEPLTTFRNNSVKTMQRLNKTRPTINANPKPPFSMPPPTGASSTSPQRSTPTKASGRDWKNFTVARVTHSTQ